MTGQPQDIETIIHSFKVYALGDIHHNNEKPIAAFILSVCFIDAISHFRYGREAKEPQEAFISEYMPKYDGIGFYNHVRHQIVHNYSSKGKLAITSKGYADKPYYLIDGVYHINTNTFLHYLELAFTKVTRDFRKKNSVANTNAREWSIKNPVLMNAYPGDTPVKI